MFSKAYCGEVEQYFEHQMILLKDRVEELKRKEAEEKGKLCSFSRMLLEQKLEEISSVLAGCDRDEREALQFLYGAMPLSDLLNIRQQYILRMPGTECISGRRDPLPGRCRRSCLPIMCFITGCITKILWIREHFSTIS